MSAATIMEEVTKAATATPHRSVTFAAGPYDIQIIEPPQGRGRWVWYVRSGPEDIVGGLAVGSARSKFGAELMARSIVRELELEAKRLG